MTGKEAMTKLGLDEMQSVFVQTMNQDNRGDKEKVFREKIVDRIEPFR